LFDDNIEVSIDEESKISAKDQLKDKDDSWSFETSIMKN